MKEKNGDASGKRQVKLLFPIGAKLIISFSLILFIVLFLINNLSSAIVARNLEKMAKEANAEVNSLFAVELEYRFNSVRKEVHLLLDFIRIAGKDSYAARQAAAAFFERSYFIAAVCVPGYIELVDDFFFINNNVNPDYVSAWVSRESGRIQRAREGEPVISNPSAELGAPFIAMFYPWQQNEREEAIVILFSPDGFAEIFGSYANNSFLVNADADVLVHFDYRMVLQSSNVSTHPLFIAFSDTDDREMRILYTDNGVKYFGAGKKLSLANMMVFSSAEYHGSSTIAADISRSNLLLIGSIIFISIVLIWLISKTISVPLNSLLNAVSRLEEGKFEADLDYHFPDEIGIISDRFNKMGKSLMKKIPEKQVQPRKKSRK